MLAAKLRQPFPESGLLAVGCVGPQSEWVSIAGSKVGCDLNDLYVVMRIRERAPLFMWSTIRKSYMLYLFKPYH